MTHPGPEQGIGHVPVSKPPIYSLGNLDVRTLRTNVDRDEDGEPILVVDDGDVSVTFESGLSQAALAILGAERLASAAREYAEAIRYLTRIR